MYFRRQNWMKTKNKKKASPKSWWEDAKSRWGTLTLDGGTRPPCPPYNLSTERPGNLLIALRTFFKSVLQTLLYNHAN